MMERTESSRLMRGARKVFYEYILELHGRTSLKISFLAFEKNSAARVGRDGGMHVTAGEYYRMAIVLSEVDSASCL